MVLSFRILSVPHCLQSRILGPPCSGSSIYTLTHFSLASSLLTTWNPFWFMFSNKVTTMLNSLKFQFLNQYLIQGTTVSEKLSSSFGSHHISFPSYMLAAVLNFLIFEYFSSSGLSSSPGLQNSAFSVGHFIQSSAEIPYWQLSVLYFSSGDSNKVQVWVSNRLLTISTWLSLTP